jgi:hypothetical protein
MCRSVMRAGIATHGTLAALAALTFSACQQADVGQPCDLDVSSGSPPVDVAVSGQQGAYCSANTADYFRSGATQCDNLICIRSADGAACPDGTALAAYPTYVNEVRKYCSKPCVSDGDCKNDRIHLVCRAVVFDPAYLNFLNWCAVNPTGTDPTYGPCPANAAAMLGSVPSSNYCATP